MAVKHFVDKNEEIAKTLADIGNMIVKKVGTEISKPLLYLLFSTVH